MEKPNQIQDEIIRYRAHCINCFASLSSLDGMAPLVACRHKSSMQSHAYLMATQASDVLEGHQVM